jgi:hypothetical protein
MNFPVDKILPNHLRFIQPLLEPDYIERKHVVSNPAQNSQKAFVLISMDSRFTQQ